MHNTRPTVQFLDLVTCAALDLAAGLAVVLGTAADPSALPDAGGRPVLRPTAEDLRLAMIRTGGLPVRYFARVPGGFHEVARCGG